jgi:hypothetical protein
MKKRGELPRPRETLHDGTPPRREFPTGAG